MKNKSGIIKNFIILIFCIIIIYAFSFLEFTQKEIKYFNRLNETTGLTSTKEITESFDIKSKNIDSVRFFVNVGKINEKYTTFFNNNIEEYDKYKIPTYPSVDFDNKRASILFTIKTENKGYSKIVFLSDLKVGDNDIEIFTPNFKDIHYKIIDVQIKCNNIQLTQNINLYMNLQKNYSTNTMINNIELDNEISSIITVHSYNIILLIGLIFACLVFFIYNTLKYDLFNEKIKSGTLFSIEFILSIVFSVSLLKFNINYSAYEVVSRLYLILMVISLFILIKLILFGIKKYGKCLEKLFVILTLFTGMMYVFAMIPNGVPDENHHYYEADKLSKLNFISGPYYQMSEKFVMCEGSQKNYKCLNEIFFNAKDTDKKGVLTNTANGYNDVLYVPSAIGIATGRLFGLNICIGYYLGRILNLLVTIIFGYYSIKLLSRGKLILLVFLLNPMYLHQGMAFSADVLTNAITILFISFMMSDKEKLSNKEKISLLFLTLGFYIIKRPYVFLLLLLLIRIKRVKKFNREKTVKIICVGLVILFAYMTITNLNYTVYSEYSISTIIRNPFDFISLFMNTLKLNGNKYFQTMFGSSLGWFEIDINGIYIYTYLAILFVATFVDKMKLNFKQIIAIIISVLLVVLSIFIGFLTIYSNRSEEVIFGIQGRYFLPVAILVFYLISNFTRKIKLNIEYNKVLKIFSIILIVLHMLIIFQVANFYM